MNKSYWKSALRTVRSSMSRFAAIFAIVALGAGFLSGVLASPVDMRLSADSYFDQSDMFDLRVVSTMGLTDGDIQALSEVSGVSAVMAAYDTDLVLISEDGQANTTRIHSLPATGQDGLNTLELLQGRMPTARGECAIVVDHSFLGDGERIGERFSIDPDEEAHGLPREFEVVGLVRSALYISMEEERSTAGSGSLDMKIFTPAESFDQDFYTAAYLQADGAKELNSFGAAYEELCEDISDALGPLGEDRSIIRYEEIVGDARAELDSAQEEYESAKAKAYEELSDGERELLDAQSEIDKNEKKLSDALKELTDGKKQFEEGQSALESQRAAAKEQIDSGQAQIDAAQSSLDAGQAQLSAARAELDKGYAELAASEAELAKAKERLDETAAQLDAIDQGKAALFSAAAALGLPETDGSDQAALELIDLIATISPESAAQFEPLKQALLALVAQGTDSSAARELLNAGLSEYHQGVAQAEAAKEKLDQGLAQLSVQQKELDQAQAQINAQRAKLQSGKEQMEAAISQAAAQLNQAQLDLDKGQAEYDDGVKKLEEGKKDLADGWDEYEKGKKEAEKELAEAKEELDKAELDIAKIEQGEWLVYTRQDNTGFQSYASNADKIAAIAQIFPVFFFIVAALVALTTMTRMVEEERLQIGTMKALGYGAAKIAMKYLLYAAAGSLLGCVAGVLFGMWLFPTVIINAYNIIYDLPDILTPFSWPLALLSGAAATLCTLMATLWACWSALRENPARLLLPKAPKAGKRILLERITPIWNRMKFTKKVTARNLFRYKKRFFMTVTGIAGCTALLVTGFGIRDSVSDIVGIQYGELSDYELIVWLLDDAALSDQDFVDILKDPAQVSDWLPALQDSGKVDPKEGCPADDITIFAPMEPTKLTDFFTFRHRTGGQPIEYTEDSVIITEKLSERQRLKVGEKITVENQDGKKASFTITDICENYVSHYLYISPKAYSQAFEDEARASSVLCKLPQDGPAAGTDQLSTKILKCEDAAAVTFTEELSESFYNSIQSINYIVVVLIVSAGALAFVVLYNLTNINITEREKELATIKVLGFYDREVAAYVYRETAMLTLIGTAAGLLLGVLLHQFVIRTAEIDMVMFGRRIYFLSYVFATVLTVLFSALVNLVMYKKLTSISMVESMKAPE